MTYDLFVSGRRVRQLVERNFEIIGLRNQLIHAYDNMDWELIWKSPAASANAASRS